MLGDYVVLDSAGQAILPVVIYSLLGTIVYSVEWTSVKLQSISSDRRRPSSILPSADAVGAKAAQVVLGEARLQTTH